MLVGFTMPRVGGEEYRPIFDYWNPKRRNSISGLKGNREAIDRLLEGIITNVINTVKGIHQKGYIIWDINEKNILVGPNALINIIDCDSFQVRGYKGKYYTCPVGRPDYTSPRLLSELKQICTDTRCSHQPGQKRSYSCLIRTKDDDAIRTGGHALQAADGRVAPLQRRARLQRAGTNPERQTAMRNRRPAPDAGSGKRKVAKAH